MKVLKHGTYYYEPRHYARCPECDTIVELCLDYPKVLSCGNCGCLFEYDDADVKTFIFGEDNNACL